MKYSNFLLILFSSFLFGGLISCKKYLEENPKSQISDANYYKTLSDAQGAIGSIYTPIWQVFSPGYMQQVEIKADYGYGRGSTAPVGQYQGLDQVNISRTDLIWTLFYRAINRANIAIDKISQMNSISQSQKDPLIAEAKFMRAFSYFHLVINWGAVPLYRSSADSLSGRTPVPDIYNSIIGDLTTAENALPATPSQYGHPTSWSAKSLRALVYLYEKKWDSATILSQEVINSGVYALVPVVQPDDFDNIFGAGANGTSEEVFYIKYNHIIGWEWPLNMLWTATQWAPFGNYVVYEDPNNSFITNWKNNDLRKQFDLFTEYINPATGNLEQLTFPPMLCSKFRDPNSTGRDGFGNDYTFLRYAEVLLTYAEASDMENNGPTQLGLEYLNRVKRRAYGLPINQPSSVDYPTTGWTPESFRDSVMKERGYEFFMEGKRWEDLKRTGTAAQVILDVKGITIKQAALLWPIPLQEIQTNPNITQADQNPGY